MTQLPFSKSPLSDKTLDKETQTHLDAARPIPADTSIQVRIITHNIRYATPSPFKGEEKWPVRCPRLCSELVFNSPVPETFICLQEVLHPQLLDIHSSLYLSNPGEPWEYIGIGRDDGKTAGEYSPIFYRPHVWELLRWECRWLSETPLVPSKGWDASSIRILTTGVFKHRQSKRTVVVMNTHLDDQGAESREEAAKQILDMVATQKDHKHSGVFLAGDFNSPPDGGAYKIMTDPKSSMEDVGLKVPQEKRYGNEMTFTGFSKESEQSRIDFIFSRRADKLKFLTYGVLANRFDDDVYSSDHRACIADVQILGEDK